MVIILDLRENFMIFLNLKLCPVPTKPVPILIGGHSNLALKRAARIGDGWISAGLTLEETETLINKINSFREGIWNT